MFRRLLPALILLALAPASRAELIDFKVLRREPLAKGKAYGEAGAYEAIIGIARFAVDPKHPRNRIIVDLDHAPVNRDGKVEFEADVYILAPKDLSRSNGAVLYDVNNRGNKLALRMFNSESGNNQPHSGADTGNGFLFRQGFTVIAPTVPPRRGCRAGNGFLFRQGFTVVWSGWIAEVLPGDGRMILGAPIATDNGKPIVGPVRFEMVTDTPAETLPLARRENLASYPPADDDAEGATLTWRLRETDERVPIPREQWSLVRVPTPKVEQGVTPPHGQIRLKLSGGFRPGYIYELIYRAKDPVVQGVGLAGVRDLVSFIKNDAGKSNPLTGPDGKPVIARAHGFGVSQSGRFLRHFLYQGFNADEKDRKVFDGIITHVAGGGLGFFNHRFAQPTRHNGQHEEHDYPADVFPFTYGISEDSFSKRTDGILRRLTEEDPKLLPIVLHTQSAAEYWHRSGSLVHTDPRGKSDVEIPGNVRIFAFGGTQHSATLVPPQHGICDNLMNPGDYRPFLRALLANLDDSVKKSTSPVASIYPRIDKGTLVGWRQKETGFPALPGVRYPEVIQQPQARDYGERFLETGIITREPPSDIGSYPVLVPKSDADGNDLGCLLPPEVGVPLATYTGWNLRRREVGAEAQLASLFGTYLPFPTTAEERRATGDPRRAVRERYRDFAHFKQESTAYCTRLVEQGYLLREDMERHLAGLQRHAKLFGE